MFIVFGRRGRISGTRVVETECDFCKSPRALRTVVQRYFHIFWIPTVPLSTSVIRSCPQCRHSVEVYPQGEEKVKPLWMFTGLAMIVGFVILVILTKPSPERQANQPQIESVEKASMTDI